MQDIQALKDAGGGGTTVIDRQNKWKGWRLGKGRRETAPARQGSDAGFGYLRRFSSAARMALPSNWDSMILPSGLTRKMAGMPSTPWTGGPFWHGRFAEVALHPGKIVFLQEFARLIDGLVEAEADHGKVGAVFEFVMDLFQVRNLGAAGGCARWRASTACGLPAPQRRCWPRRGCGPRPRP